MGGIDLYDFQRIPYSDIIAGTRLGKEAQDEPQFND